MRYIVLTTAMAFIGGLFAAGLALGAGQSQWGGSSQMDQSQMGQDQMGKSQQQNKQQQYGSASQNQRGQQQQQQIAGQQLNQQTVRELQKKLDEQGFNPGPVDGILGPKTKGAIQQFQREEGLAVSGQPNKETLDALDIEAQEFFGVSPEFGKDKGQRGQTEEQGMQQREQQQQQQQQPYEQQQQEPGSMEQR